MAFVLVRVYLVLDSHITRDPTLGQYWGIDATIRYGVGNGSYLIITESGIIDTGTTLVYLATGKLLCDSRILPGMCTQTHNTLLC